MTEVPILPDDIFGVILSKIDNYRCLLALMTVSKSWLQHIRSAETWACAIQAGYTDGHSLLHIPGSNNYTGHHLFRVLHQAAHSIRYWTQAAQPRHFFIESCDDRDTLVMQDILLELADNICFVSCADPSRDSAVELDRVLKMWESVHSTKPSADAWPSFELKFDTDTKLLSQRICGVRYRGALIAVHDATLLREVIPRRSVCWGRCVMLLLNGTPELVLKALTTAGCSWRDRRNIQSILLDPRHNVRLSELAELPADAPFLASAKM
eukprot:TRINITY_DN11765_c0_g1_i1.p1 TRINITY_DN11765_c0_g1~~TRINITY_DN11765_c0_g1_i1.p1  ORF type:complete len:267 (-),score=39.83 TRINITY_DN11765_c0_g1_i1:229-1029(-)